MQPNVITYHNNSHYDSDCSEFSIAKPTSLSTFPNLNRVTVCELRLKVWLPHFSIIRSRMDYKALVLLIAVRVASVFVVQTFFSPDEYWQSLEVGHKITFG